jgi:glycosyltransferase involved in cell wall biosynthesis
MKVSIAVPSFNQGQFLDDCLGSIARQSHTDFEVLIADGGSRDESIAVAERYASSDARFKLVSRSDAGQADAIVQAFAQSTGDVLGFLNSDDCYLDTQILERACRAFEAHPEAGLVSFGGYYIDAAGQTLKRIDLRIHPLDSLANLPYRASVLQPGTFWRRAVLDTVGIRTEFHYCFDAIFFWQAWQRFGWVEETDPLIGYRLHGDNKSMQVRPERIAELARFERLKFGEGSLRARYLGWLACVVAVLGRTPVVGRALARMVYLVNNSAAFATFYRWPGI